MENIQTTNPSSEITLEDLMAKDINFKIEEDNKPGDFVPDLTAGIPKAEEEEPKEEEAPKEESTEDKDKPAEEAPKDEPKVSTDVYLNMSKKLIGEGKWSDVMIEVDGKEIKLSEAEEVDEDTFLQVYEAQEAARKEEIEANYISVKNIDEDKKKLISIITNGGDLKELFKDESQVKKPFENVDLTNETTQKSIVYQQYRNQGLSEGEARDLTEKAAKEFTLDTKVDSIVKAYQAHYEKTLAEKEKEVIATKQAEEAAIKEYRKELSTSYKADNIPETIAKRLVDAATKKDAEGNLVIDGIYEKIMDDPARAKELIFFMLEPDNFLQLRGAGVKKQEQVAMMRTVKIIRDTAAKSGAKEETVEEKPNDPFSNLVLEEKK